MWKSVMGELITNAEYKKFKPSHQYREGHDNKPVGNVSFNEAMEYAAWLSKKTGRCYRLPTEEETIEAEKTFKCDFSAWPLCENPDVGTVGRNADGVTGLLGHMFAWQANESDVAEARAGWKRNKNQKDEVTPASEITDEFQQVVQIVERTKKDIDQQIADLIQQRTRLLEKLIP